MEDIVTLCIWNNAKTTFGVSAKMEGERYLKRNPNKKDIQPTPPHRMLASGGGGRIAADGNERRSKIKGKRK